MIYLDNNATTPIAPEVLDAMHTVLTENYGNPSSGHSGGRAARVVVEAARADVAAMLGASKPDEVVFTASGTEADNWSVFGAIEMQHGRKHIVTTTVEHEAVRKSIDLLERRGCDVTRIGVDENGHLDLDELRSTLRGDTALVSVMHANNETGILFPIKEIGEIVKQHSQALFHVDGVNAAGKVPLDLSSTNVDLYAVSAHKFYGPKGIGVLYIREGVTLPQILIGGGQERGRRAGTEAVHQIAGMGAAARLAASTPKEQISKLRDRLESAILSTVPDAYLNGTVDVSVRLPNTSSISFAQANGALVMMRLDDQGICVSTGSACNSQGNVASAVLQAMDVPYERAMGSIRFSIGRYNTEDEIERVLEVLPGIVADIRAIAGI
jgi:cysteine desulfurase